MHACHFEILSGTNNSEPSPANRQLLSIGSRNLPARESTNWQLFATNNPTGLQAETRLPAPRRIVHNNDMMAMAHKIATPRMRKEFGGLLAITGGVMVRGG